MAVNTFTFGGITSSTYGIYVSGEGLFNAPKRDAEVVQIPGRDGDFILDKGSFENIEVTYRVFNQEKDLSDFRTKLANLRSALCSQTGYQRLTDTFHPNEYRMAAFIDGIEVNPVKYNTASEFEIKFNCKPQRYLTSGETAVSVASGGKVTNPTLFDAKPQLQVWGYGDISVGGADISVVNATLGTVIYPFTSNIGGSLTANLNDGRLDAGDSLIVGASSSKAVITFPAGYSITATNISISGTGVSLSTAVNDNVVTINVSREAVPMTYSTSSESLSLNNSAINYEDANGNFDTLHLTGTLYCMISSNVLTVRLVINTDNNGLVTRSFASYCYDGITGTSTVSALGSPSIIDLDIGEAYMISNNNAISINDAVQIPAELPTLPPGDTTFTYDNTITQFKVVPNWWRV